MSEAHWTPLAAAVLAAQWLCARRYGRVLDVGSGVGKFSVAAALSQRGRFVGAELRQALVEAAIDLAAVTGAHRATFLHADALELDWSSFNGLYLFNPFAELLLPDARRVAADLRGGSEEYQRSVERTEAKLAALPAGFRVVTFHGFGGSFPPGFRRVASEWVDSGFLELWVKQELIPDLRGPPGP